MEKNKLVRFICIILALILIVGTILIFIKGFNKEPLYKNGEKIIITLDEEVNNDEIKQIVTESVNGDAQIQTVGIFGDCVIVTVDEINEEQKQTLVDKINEKYYADKDVSEQYVVSDLDISPIAEYRVRDLVKPVVLSLSLATIFAVVFYVVRFKCLDKYLTIIKVIASVVIAQWFLLCVLVITRIPVGVTTQPLMIVTFILTLLGLNQYFGSKCKQSQVKN